MFYNFHFSSHMLHLRREQNPARVYSLTFDIALGTRIHTDTFPTSEALGWQEKENIRLLGENNVRLSRENMESSRPMRRIREAMCRCVNLLRSTSQHHLPSLGLGEQGVEFLKWFGDIMRSEPSAHSSGWVIWWISPKELLGFNTHL